MLFRSEQRADCSVPIKPVSLLFCVLENKVMKMESKKKDAERAQVVCRISLCSWSNWHKPYEAVPDMLAVKPWGHWYRSKAFIRLRIYLNFLNILRHQILKNMFHRGQRHSCMNKARPLTEENPFTGGLENGCNSRTMLIKLDSNNYFF